MRKILIGVLLGSSLLLASCGAESSNYLSTTSVEEIADIKTEQESAYVLVDSDSQGNEGAYVDTVREVATEKKKDVLLFNPFQPNGEDLEERSTQEHPELKGGRLYEMTDGEISRELNVSALTEDELKDQITNFIK